MKEQRQAQRDALAERKSAIVSGRDAGADERRLGALQRYLRLAWSQEKRGQNKRRPER